MGHECGTSHSWLWCGTAVPFIVVRIIVVITLAVVSVAVDMNTIILCMFLVS